MSFWYWEHCRKRPHVRYFIFRRIGWHLAYLPNSLILHSQLMLIRKRQIRFHGRPPSQHPRETG